MFSPSVQTYRVGTHIILVHPLQLAVDLLPQLLGVGVGEEAGHDGGGDDELWTPVDPLHTVSSRTGSGPSPPGPVEDWDPPDGAGLGESEGPVESVSLQPPRVQVSVELVALVTSRQVVVKLRGEAGHVVGDIIREKMIALVLLVNRKVPVSSWLSFSGHVGLEICVGLSSCRGGEVGQVGDQVVLVVRADPPTTSEWNTLGPRLI